MSERYVKLFRYDPINDPCSRLRLDYDPDDGVVDLVCESTHLEQVDNPDARHRGKSSHITLTTREMRWLATHAAELADLMERGDAEANDRIEARKR